jgi:hypothetical protein
VQTTDECSTPKEQKGCEPVRAKPNPQAIRQVAPCANERPQVPQVPLAGGAASAHGAGSHTTSLSSMAAAPSGRDSTTAASA